MHSLLLQLMAQVGNLVRAARERMRRRTFLLSFSAAPADFIRALVSSQGRELRGSQKAGAVARSMRRTQFFRGK